MCHNLEVNASFLNVIAMNNDLKRFFLISYLTKIFFCCLMFSCNRNIIKLHSTAFVIIYYLKLWYL